MVEVNLYNAWIRNIYFLSLESCCHQLINVTIYLLTIPLWQMIYFAVSGWPHVQNETKWSQVRRKQGLQEKGLCYCCKTLLWYYCAISLHLICCFEISKLTLGMVRISFGLRNLCDSSCLTFCCLNFYIWSFHIYM